MAPGCLLTSDAIASRLRRRTWFEVGDPAAGYAVCRRCQSAISSLVSRLARRLGYLADCRRDPATVPVYWRQTTWMLLDSVRRAVLSGGVDHSASA
jgi:hypothetical protein